MGRTTNRVNRNSAGGRKRRTTASFPFNRQSYLVGELPGALHGLRRILRCHDLCRDIRRYVIDDGADGWTEHLIVEDLVVSRMPDVLRDATQDWIGDGVLRAFDDWNIEAPGGGLALKFRVREILQEVDSLGRRALGDQPAVEAAERV